MYKKPLFSDNLFLNPFPNTPFWDRLKFKEDADDNCNVVIKEF